jgi:LysR family transcriptional regulator, regulator for metE and metH
MSSPRIPAIRLEVRDLRLVATVAELGTLTGAGRRLFLTQSALSHQLADLERRLGAPLFERSGRRMLPTLLGERLRTHAIAALKQIDDAERDVAALANGRDAVIRLATECYTCYHWLPPVLKEFWARHPSVDIRVVPEATSDPVGALLAGTLDLCVTTSTVEDRRVVTDPLFDDEQVLVVSEEHRLAGKKSVDVSELLQERFLMYSPPEDSFTFRNVLNPAGVSPSQISTLKLTEAIVELVRANMGVTVLARWAVLPYLAAGGLETIRVAHPGMKRSWQAKTRAGQAKPKHLEDFIEFLARTMERPPRNKPEFGVVRSVSKSSPDRRRIS